MTDIETTLNERKGNYGTFEDNAIVAQQIKVIFEESSKYHRCSASQQEALDLIATKLARIVTGDPNYIDNWHDISGYATLIEKQLENRNEKA